MTSSAAIVRRVAPRRQMTDAKLGLRRALSRHNRQPRRRHPGRLECRRRLDRHVGRRGAHPSSRRTTAAARSSCVVRERAGDDERRPRRPEHRRVQRRDLVQREPSQCRVAADRQVPVRMLRVHEPQERALGHGGRKILELREAVEPQLANAIEVVLPQTGPRRHVGEQRRAALGELHQRRQRKDGDVGIHVHVVVGADARQARRTRRWR